MKTSVLVGCNQRVIALFLKSIILLWLSSYGSELVWTERSGAEGTGMVAFVCLFVLKSNFMLCVFEFSQNIEIARRSNFGVSRFLPVTVPYRTYRYGT